MKNYQMFYIIVHQRVFLHLKNYMKRSNNEETHFNKLKIIFLNKNHIKYLKKQPRIKNYFPIVAKFKNEVLQIDLADMSNISSVNDGVKFLLIAIDVFSRSAYVIPLRNKKNADKY